jgi:hypothetical protein
LGDLHHITWVFAIQQDLLRASNCGYFWRVLTLKDVQENWHSLSLLVCVAYTAHLWHMLWWASLWVIPVPLRTSWDIGNINATTLYEHAYVFSSVFCLKMHHLQSPSRWTWTVPKPTSGFWTESAGPILLQYSSPSIYCGGCLVTLGHIWQVTGVTNACHLLAVPAADTGHPVHYLSSMSSLLHPVCYGTIRQNIITHLMK